MERADMDAALSWLDDELLALNDAEVAMNTIGVGEAMIPTAETPPPQKAETEIVTRSQSRQTPQQSKLLTDANHNLKKKIVAKNQQKTSPKKELKPKQEPTKVPFPTLQLDVQEDKVPHNTPTQNGDMAQPAMSSKPPTSPPETADTSHKDKENELDFYMQSLMSKMDDPGEKDMLGYCGKCNKVVDGDEIACSAMDKIFHVDCFCCKTCEHLLHGSQFYVVEKEAFCETCYIKSLEKCTVCSDPITDRILRATGKPYHPACFKCVVCGQCMDGVPFTVDAANEIHCVEDFHKKFAPKCSVCSEPIMPESGKEETVRIVVLDRSFHVNCYKCEKCDMKFSSEEGKGCFPLDGRILCRDCNTATVQELNQKAA